MKKVYSSPDTLFLGHLRNLLENEGIPCTVLRDNLIGTLGGLPPIECWAELWVLDELLYNRASEIIKRSLERDFESNEKKWKCYACGEELEPQFVVCWNCGGLK